MYISVSIRIRTGDEKYVHKLGPYSVSNSLTGCNKWMLAVSKGVEKLNKAHGPHRRVIVLFGLSSAAPNVIMAKLRPADVIANIAEMALDTAVWPPPKDFDKKDGSL